MSRSIWNTPTTTWAVVPVNGGWVSQQAASDLVIQFRIRTGVAVAAVAETVGRGE